MTDPNSPEYIPDRFPDIPLWMTRRHRPGGQKDEFERGRGKVVYVSAEGREVPCEEYEHWGGR